MKVQNESALADGSVYVGPNVLLLVPDYQNDYAATLMDDAEDGLRDHVACNQTRQRWENDKSAVERSLSNYSAALGKTFSNRNFPPKPKQSIEDLLFTVALAEYEELQSELGISDAKYMGQSFLECIDDPCGVRDNFLSKAQHKLGYSGSYTRKAYSKAAKRVAEAQIEWAEPVKPQTSKPKDKRPAIVKAMATLAAGLSDTITEQELNTATNKLAARSDFDAVAQANWVDMIVANTPLGRVAAKKILKGSLETARQANKEEADHNIVGVSGHNDQCRYVAKKLVEANKGKKHPRLLRYGYNYSTVRHLAEEGQTDVQILSKDGFNAMVNGCAPFWKVEEKSSRVVPAPPAVARDVMETQMPEIPYLRQVTNYVQFDGEVNLLAKNGYHESAYLYMHLPDDLVMPAFSFVPSKEEVQEAIRILVEEWLADWPFDGYSRREILVACGVEKPATNEVTRPVPPSLLSFLGFVLQPLVRPIIKGPVPGLLITKPEAGTGASLLTDTAIAAVHGKTSTRTMPKDEEERSKQVFAALLAGDPFLFFDNVTGQVDSPVLAALLTSTNYTGRILGKSEEATIPNQTSPIITGNNPRFTRELQRRLSLCRLDAGVAKPEEREPEGGWRHPDIEEWVAQNRGQIIWALCTLVMHWKANDCPKPSGKPLGSYRSWYEVCGGILEAAGLEGWQSNRQMIEQVAGADDDDPMREFVAQWYDVATTKGGALALEGQLAKQLSAFADNREIDLPVARHVVDTERLYKPSAFGQYLGTQAERVFEVDDISVKIEADKKTKNGKPWKLTIL